MATFTDFVSVQREGAGGYVRANCEISGESNEDSAKLDLKIHDEAGHSVNLSFRFFNSEDGVNIALIRTGEPMTDYAICVLRKVGGSVGGAAWDCYFSSDNWDTFLDCIKQKAPSLGMKAAISLLTCVGSIVGLEF